MIQGLSREQTKTVVHLKKVKFILRTGAKIHSGVPVTVALEFGAIIVAPLIDASGNICRLIDPFSSKIVSQYELTAFGEEKNASIDENPWRFAAKRFDPDLNIIYFGKRDYDPELGRWLTPDPAGFVNSLNLYQYVFNNPFSHYGPESEFVVAVALICLTSSRYIYLRFENIVMYCYTERKN